MTRRHDMDFHITDPFWPVSDGWIHQSAMGGSPSQKTGNVEFDVAFAWNQ